MDRVFRGAGAVVEFNLDGRVQGVDQQNYIDFLNALIPPRGESQIRIKGPSFSSLVEGATLGVFLYDVVTETDTAGNIVARENFEWFFSLSRERIVEEISAPQRSVWLPNTVASYMARADEPFNCFVGVYPRDNY